MRINSEHLSEQQKAWERQGRYVADHVTAQTQAAAHGPPIPLLDVDSLTPELTEVLGPRIERLGYLGAFFRAGAHQPRALLAFNELTEALKAALPADLTELVALRVASHLGNTYERNQHEQLAHRQGRPTAWIAAAEQRPGHDRGALDTPTQQAVASLVDALLRDAGHDVDLELQEVTEHLGPADTMAVLLLVGRYLAHATISNALRFESPVPPVVVGPGS